MARLVSRSRQVTQLDVAQHPRTSHPSYVLPFARRPRLESLSLPPAVRPEPLGLPSLARESESRICFVARRRSHFLIQFLPKRNLYANHRTAVMSLQADAAASPLSLGIRMPCRGAPALSAHAHTASTLGQLRHPPATTLGQRFYCRCHSRPARATVIPADGQRGGAIHASTLSRLASVGGRQSLAALTVTGSLTFVWTLGPGSPAAGLSTVPLLHPIRELPLPQSSAVTSPASLSPALPFGLAARSSQRQCPAFTPESVSASCHLARKEESPRSIPGVYHLRPPGRHTRRRSSRWRLSSTISRPIRLRHELARFRPKPTPGLLGIAVKADFTRIDPVPTGRAPTNFLRLSAITTGTTLRRCSTCPHASSSVAFSRDAQVAEGFLLMAR